MAKLIHITQKGDTSYSIDKAGDYIFFLDHYSGTFKVDIHTINAKVYIFGLYIGTKSDHFKLNTIQHHASGDSISDLLIKGVFFNNSKLLYEGLIKIDQFAQRSNAYQKNQNLILSPDVFVDSRPFLEILANDVRCTHGSTTGRLNKDELLYLQTRGLSRRNAEKLLVEGFIHDVFDKIHEIVWNSDVEEIKKSCLRKLTRYYDSH